MHLFEGMLYRLIKNDSKLEAELKPNGQVKRVLVMRNNKRIGNILFLITFVCQVRLAYSTQAKQINTVQLFSRISALNQRLLIASYCYADLL